MGICISKLSATRRVSPRITLVSLRIVSVSSNRRSVTCKIRQLRYSNKSVPINKAPEKNTKIVIIIIN